MNNKLRLLLEKQVALLRQLLALKSMRSFTDVVMSRIGTDASPHDLAPDELGCAETITTVRREYDGTTPIMIGTWSAYVYLEHPANGWERIKEPEPECLILSPTGLGKKGKHGHIGVCILVNGQLVVISNDSRTGKFIQNFTPMSWLQYFGSKDMGFPTFYYRKK